MNRIWRIVLFLTLALVAMGIVLLGAGWLTGASVPRVIELVFGGEEALNASLTDLLNRWNSLWNDLTETLLNLF